MDVIYTKDFKKIIDSIDLSRLKGRVGLKVHFGERGCKTFVNPELVKQVYYYLESHGFDVYLIECNVLYRGSRNFSSDHIKLAKEHGFNFGEIDILDGEKGDEMLSIKIDEKNFKEIKVGNGIENYDSMLVLSHFKGHELSGFGGALKNVGMGLASRSGKLHLHATVSPIVNDKKCVGCGLCVEGCDFNAIDIKNNKVCINSEKCVGCAMCISVCPHGAVMIPWGSCGGEELQEKICEYTKGIMDFIGRDSFVFINVLEDITPLCDCVGIEQEKIMDNLGFVLSNDVVSVDKCSLDLVNSACDFKFDKLNSTDNLNFINYASEIDLGEKDYNLIES